MLELQLQSTESGWLGLLLGLPEGAEGEPNRGHTLAQGRGERASRDCRWNWAEGVLGGRDGGSRALPGTR